MRRSLPLAGFIVLALVAPLAHSQSHILPINPGLNFRLVQSPSLIRSNFDGSGNAPRDPIMPDNSAQDNTSALPSARVQNEQPICGITRLDRCIQDLGEDEKGIFTSPLRLQPRDAYWLAPLGAATGLAFAYDADAAQVVGVEAARTDTANKIANFGSFWATGAEGAGIYFIGLAKNNPKLAETGRLAAEAVIDSGTVTLATKLVSNRQRPRQGNGQGDFWPAGTSHGGWDTSFPSDHATATMALARVIAGEYPRWYIVVPAYGFAETVSISRILANQHFPSDIVVGQAIGFLVGSYVLNHRALHRPAKQGLAAQLIGSIHPIADARTRTLAASVEIPLGGTRPF
jgi:membrane-associated phospholipid phosphatase